MNVKPSQMMNSERKQIEFGFFFWLYFCIDAQITYIDLGGNKKK